MNHLILTTTWRGGHGGCHYCGLCTRQLGTERFCNLPKVAQLVHCKPETDPGRLASESVLLTPKRQTSIHQSWKRKKLLAPGRKPFDLCPCPQRAAACTQQVSPNKGGFMWPGPAPEPQLWPSPLNSMTFATFLTFQSLKTYWLLWFPNLWPGLSLSSCQINIEMA